MLRTPKFWFFAATLFLIAFAYFGFRLYFVELREVEAIGISLSAAFSWGCFSKWQSLKLQSQADSLSDKLQVDMHVPTGFDGFSGDGGG